MTVLRARAMLTRRVGAQVWRRRVGICLVVTVGAFLMISMVTGLATMYLSSWGNGFSSAYGTFLRAEDSLPADMVALMDLEVNPCDNFYDYGLRPAPSEHNAHRASQLTRLRSALGG